MHKLRKLAFTMTIVFILGISGCGKEDNGSVLPSEEQNGGTVTSPGEEDSAISGTQAETGDNEITLKQMAELLDQEDTKVKDLYGGGTANIMDESSVLLGRSYETTLQGKSVTLETVYDDNSKVVNVSVTFPNMEMEEVKALFHETFGESNSVDETQAMDSAYETWTADGVEIVLNASYGVITAQFTLIG